MGPTIESDTQWIAHSTSWLSWDYEVRSARDKRKITDLHVPWSGERGTFRLQGRRYEIYREGWLSGRFLLVCEGREVASATKPSAFRRAFVLEYGGQSFDFAPRAWSSRVFELCRNRTKIGAVERTSFFSRKAAVDLPKDLPEEQRIFLLWLAAMTWRRRARNSSS